MGAFSGYFPLGLGTGRFPVSGPGDTEGIEKSANIVCRALEAGVNYIDTSYSYCAGMAHTVLKEAFSRTKMPFGVTVKVMHDMDKTADDARRRVEMQLKSMGIDKAQFFVCWTIPSYEDFLEIMRKGGLYEGAVKLKDEGIIDHICCSIHAPQAEAIQIINSGVFEGATISHSLLTAIQTLPILDAALNKNVDIAVMNPLGGGVIARNPDFFSFAQSGNESTVTAALRFAKAHPAVKIVLSGFSAENEIPENVAAIAEPSLESSEDRIARVLQHIRIIDGFCVNCHYCDGCPQSIPISELMNKRNTLLFTSQERYNRTDPEVLRNIDLFYSHAHLGTGEWFPDLPENPCIRCERCEKNCTQKLKIMDAIDDMYKRAGKAGYSLRTRKDRIEELLVNKNYRRVGLYPDGGFSKMIIELYNRFWGEPEFEWLQFNSNPNMWGQSTGGLLIHAPGDIHDLEPDIIIVSTYRHDRVIFDSLKHFENEGIKIVKLHKETDVPWIF